MQRKVEDKFSENFDYFWRGPTGGPPASTHPVEEEARWEGSSRGGRRGPGGGCSSPSRWKHVVATKPVLQSTRHSEKNPRAKVG